MNNLNLYKPKRIDEAVLQNMKCGYSLELEHVNEDNFNIHDQYQLVEKLNLTERIIDIRMTSEYNKVYVPGSLNIPIVYEPAFIDKIRGYDRVFFHCHSRRRTKTVYTRISMQGLENLVCINNFGMTDWHQVSFPVGK